MDSIPNLTAPAKGTNRGLYLGFLCVLFVFGGSAVLSQLSVQSILRDRDAVDRSEQVLLAQTQVVADISKVESATRGFVASHRPDFIAEFEAGKKTLNSSLQSLQDLTPAKTRVSFELQTLDDLVQVRYRQLQSAIDRAKLHLPPRQRNDPSAVAARISRQRVNKILDTVRSAETVQMVDRRSQSAASVTWAYVGLWSSGLIGVFALLALFATVRRSVESAKALRELEHSRADDLEERVRERTRELSQANRDLEAFSYSVSHDLRAPLRAMHGYAAILRKDLQERLEPDEHKMLERIQRNCTKMSELTESLLALFRVGKAELSLEKVNISKMAANIVGELRLEFPGVDYQIDIQPGLKVTGDRQMLNALLVNLLGNAMKFSGKGEYPRIEFRGEQGEEGEIFAISDNGAGFDASQSGLLFEPFHRLHSESEFPGNGVGLAMCRKIVSRHKGTIWLDSELGKGTTVRFRLGLGIESRELVSLSANGNVTPRHSG